MQCATAFFCVPALTPHLKKRDLTPRQVDFYTNDIDLNEFQTPVRPASGFSGFLV